MSQENVEVVRRQFALLSQGDYEAFFDEFPLEGVFDFSRRLIDPVVLRGRDEMRAWIERERQMWEGDHVGYEPKELIDAGDKVLALVRVSARGKASGVEVEAYTWNVATFRDGKQVEMTYFGDDRAAAFQAAGLLERDAHADLKPSE
jgi:ketosteroid isomerase-like protein